MTSKPSSYCHMKFTPLFNIFCRDVERQMRFYQSILGWRDIPEWSSAIYRVLEQDGVQIGFNGWKAYELLGLGDRKRAPRQDFKVSSMLSFIVAQPELVDDGAQRLPALGGRVIQGPFATYYGHWQLVFADPEGNVGRLTCPTLPRGVSAPVVNLA
ncbi:MAG: VOC family protein [Piscinibacter sp.]|uniref:VOC family protein n=1 Tax=Piscinibacter sp. TaxID=1903157 RepID=UPI0025889E1A|nr:VOC family protein [Piscinibacter sp.]MCW5663863.1 VOC family protein [Piscinibacter sp.]